jgi:hypothetical protein
LAEVFAILSFSFQAKGRLIRSILRKLSAHGICIAAMRIGSLSNLLQEIGMIALAARLVGALLPEPSRIPMRRWGVVHR